MTTISRELIIGDEQVLRDFLAPYQASSMHILNNLRTTGLPVSSQHSAERKLNLYEGRYYGYFENNQLMAVIVHWWNQNMVVQCPIDCERILPNLLQFWRDQTLAMNTQALSETAADSTEDRTMKFGGLFGPDQAVSIAKSILGLNRPELPWACDSIDELMTTAFEAERLQSMLTSNLEMALPTSMPESTLIEWMVGFEQEAMGYASPDLTFIKQRIDGFRQPTDRPKARILLDSSGNPLSLIGTSCRFDNIIQIGPVWTPPNLRGRGYARQLLARIFLEELQQGSSQEATLIASDPFAIRCYKSVGFRTIGNFQLSLLNEGIPIESLQLSNASTAEQ